MANSYMKRCSTSLIIRELQITSKMRYYFIPFRMAIIKKPHKQMLVRIWRKGNPSASLVGMQIGAATIESSMELPPKLTCGTANGTAL